MLRAGFVTGSTRFVRSRARIKLVLGVLLTLCAAYALRAWFRSLRDQFQIVASGVTGGREAVDNAADNALDSRPRTAWFAPDAARAWLELRYRAPLDVAAIEITNSLKGPGGIRQTEDLEIALFRAERLLDSRRVSFERASRSAEQKTVEVASEGVTRIRLTALSYHGRGAGLADVRVVEQTLDAGR